MEVRRTVSSTEPRLPIHVEPVRYEPHLEVALDEDRFQGQVDIQVEIRSATDRIQLNASGLSFERGQVHAEEGVFELTCKDDPKRERWILEVPRSLQPGRARLSLQYEGPVRQDMTGLYRSQAGERECLVTQCEPTAARAVFPCFDEPSFKAEIAWRVTADEQLTVLANGSLEDERQAGSGRTTRVFEATPPIASYLAAVAVGDFEATDAIERRGVAFRVWALGEQAQLGEHARDFAARLLAWYESYFETPYPYEKYDQLAVPSFSFGAMENVGLVVFRAPLLLLDPDRATWDEAKAVDRVVAHEFAHMWFGNLVTMAWWDDLWLNEAFAEWIAHEAVDDLEPEHEVWHAFRHRTDQALSTDALEATHAIYHPVETPAEAMEMFDAITYGKGSAVMRMLQSFLGPEAFQEGLAAYVDAFAEDNAEGRHLWEHLARASHEPVQEVMQDWIRQPGHPCVELELLGEDDGTASIQASQHRHLARRIASREETTWPIPVVLRYADDAGIHEARRLVTQTEDRIELTLSGELSWLVGNADEGGFYRTAYDEELEQRLRAHARELTPAERWGLLRDSFSRVQAGHREPTDHLGLLEELATGQAHFAFVGDLVSHCRTLARLLEHHGDARAIDGFQAWLASTFSPAFDELGDQPRPGEDPARRDRRASVLSVLGGLAGNREALSAAREIAKSERQDPDAVDPDTATAAVHVVARHGDHRRFRTHVEVYRARRDGPQPPQQVQRYLGSLPLFQAEASVEELVGFVDDGTIPNESIGPLLERGLQEPAAQARWLAYVRAHHRDLLDRVGHAWIARIVEALGRVGPPLADEVEEFLGGPVAELAPESTERALERLQQSRELAAEGVLDALADWARGHAGGT